MSEAIIKAVEKAQTKTDLPPVAVGDSVDVHVRIVEGAKERIQVFSGVVIAFQGKGLTRMMTVRRIVANEGVERVFPMHSPRIAEIKVQRHGHTRRGKLYYLRERVGKSRRLRDKRRGLGSLVETGETAATPAAPAKAPKKEVVPAGV
jgi:large subunit ribosomal protein L19